MQHHQDALSATGDYPWNKGKLVGPKPPLRPKHVWSIRTRLHALGRTRDLAIFDLAIDSKLRGCDVVALKVEDVAPHGYALDRATVRQQKTGRSVRFELSEQTRQAIEDYLRAANKKPRDFFSLRDPVRIGVCPRANMPVSSPDGSPSLGSTQAFMARIPCAERRQR